MADGVSGAIEAALAEEPAALILVGPAVRARELFRSWTAPIAGRGHVIAFANDLEGWPGARGFLLRDIEETELAPLVRDALGQDPGWLVVEAPLAGISLDAWNCLDTAAETGHGVLVRVSDQADESAVVAAFRERSSPGFDCFEATRFPRVVVADAAGIARIVVRGEGASGLVPVWRRGDPLPSFETVTGRARRVPPPG